MSMNNLKSLFQFINQMHSLYVPMYHRGYSWDISKCRKFLEELENSEQGLNFGVIIYQKNDERGNYILIDGYNRLITILLFVQAIITSKKINLASKNHPINFLLHKEKDSDDVFKLRINNNDKNDIEYIVKNNFKSHLFNNVRFKENYDFFVDYIINNKLSLLDFLSRLVRIKISNIVVSDSHKEDDVYIEVNNTFSQIDLIRNFLYKEFKQRQTLHIFTTYWLGLEKDLGNILEDFMVDYVSIQNNGLIPKKEKLYPAFMEYFLRINRFKTAEEMIKHIYRYACFYKKIVSADIADLDINERLKKINEYGAKDAYSYLMEVFEDYEFAHINKNMLIDILDMVVEFVEARNSGEKQFRGISFSDLSKNLNKMLALKDYTPRLIKQNVDNVEEVQNISALRPTINDLMNGHNRL